MREFKIYPNNVRRHKKPQIAEQTSPTFALTIFQRSTSIRKTSNRASEGKQINKDWESFVCIVTLLVLTKIISQRKTGRTQGWPDQGPHTVLPAFCSTQSNYYSRTPLFRTRLIRSPRYFEGRSNSLGFTLMFSVIY